MSLNFMPTAHCFFGDILGSNSEYLFIAMVSGFTLSFFCSTYLIFLCLSIKQKNILTKLTLIQAICDLFFSFAFYVEMDAMTSSLCTYFAVIVSFFVNGSLFSIALLSLSTLFEKRSEQQKFEEKLNRNLLFCFAFDIIHGFFVYAIKNFDSNVIQFGVGFGLTAILILIIIVVNLRLVYRIKYYKMKLENKTPVLLTVLILLVWIEGIVEQALNLNSINYFYLLLVTAFLQEGVGAINFIVSFKRIRYFKLLAEKKSSISSKGRDSLTCQMYQALEAC